MMHGNILNGAKPRFRRSDHPVCASLRSAHPPLLCEEGNNRRLGRKVFQEILQLFLVILFVAAPCLAQEAPAWEVFGGYSFQKADVREYFQTTAPNSPLPPRPPLLIYTSRQDYVNMNGWEFAVTENRNRWFGGTLDISGSYRTPQVLRTANAEQIYSILYGPRFSYRRPFGTAFAHVLAGAAHTNVTVGPPGPHASDLSFSMALGGGLDVPLK